MPEYFNVWQSVGIRRPLRIAIGLHRLSLPVFSSELASIHTDLSASLYPYRARKACQAHEKVCECSILRVLKALRTLVLLASVRLWIRFMFWLMVIAYLLRLAFIPPN